MNIDKIVNKTEKGFIVSTKGIDITKPNNSLSKAINKIEPLLTYGFNETSKVSKFRLDYIEFQYINKENEFMYRWGGKVIIDNKETNDMPNMGWCSTYDFGHQEINGFNNSRSPLIYDVFIEAELLLKEVANV